MDCLAFSFLTEIDEQIDNAGNVAHLASYRIGRFRYYRLRNMILSSYVVERPPVSAFLLFSPHYIQVSMAALFASRITPYFASLSASRGFFFSLISLFRLGLFSLRITLRHISYRMIYYFLSFHQTFVISHAFSITDIGIAAECFSRVAVSLRDRKFMSLSSSVNCNIDKLGYRVI